MVPQKVAQHPLYLRVGKSGSPPMRDDGDAKLGSPPGRATEALQRLIEAPVSVAHERAIRRSVVKRALREPRLKLASDLLLSSRPAHRVNPVAGYEVGAGTACGAVNERRSIS